MQFEAKKDTYITGGIETAADLDDFMIKPGMFKDCDFLNYFSPF